MHRAIGAVAHAVIDYALVVLLAIAPSVAGFSGRQATFAWTLAAVLFVLNITTRHPLGVIKAVHFPVHGALEMLIGVLLVILPWLADFAAGVRSRRFFVAFGFLLLMLWAVTDYRGLRPPRRT